MPLSRPRRDDGFTLIELLVVILIIAVLIAVAAPSFLGQTTKAHDSASKQYLTVAYKAATAWATDHTGASPAADAACASSDQGDYCDPDSVAVAIHAFEPELTAEAVTGGCPLAATADPKHIIVESASAGNLTICNDPDHRVWTLNVVDHQLQPFGPVEIVPLGGSGPPPPASTFALTVSKAGAGSGTVTSSPPGISCGLTCSADYDDGTVVTLTASAAVNSDFSGWSGTCSGSGSCPVTMSQARAVTATFVAISSSHEDGTMWRDSTDISILDNDFDPNTGEIIGPAPQSPAIAIVDSGVDASRAADFGSRVVASVDSSGATVSGDPLGHGTMMAGLAAGDDTTYPGASRNAPIVSVRAVNASGVSTKSDVIAAANWILAHKATYNIKVAVFPMNTANATTFRFDALDQAVEVLWFNGIVVVTAAGNHGNGSPVDMSYAPANDPFVITVGGVDQTQTSDPSDDVVSPLSAYGHTMDGFWKPDVSAPSRYLVGPVPGSSTLATQAPARVSSGYMWMSDDALSAAIVAGAAADILARQPSLSPDEVKGALMLAANYLPSTGGDGSPGVGEIDAGVASTITGPPNPNENLNAFVSSQTFNQAAWKSAVEANSSWCPSSAWGSCSAFGYPLWSSSSYTSGGLAAAPAGTAMRSAVNWAP